MLRTIPIKGYRQSNMASDSIRGNYFVCKNNVVVEGQSIGNFATFATNDSREQLSQTATISMPFYTILPKSLQTSNKNASTARLDVDKYKIVFGAHIQVYVWYECAFDGSVLDKILAFDGFITDVVNGFPTVIKCEDYSFALRFGTINSNEDWEKSTPIQTIMTSLIGKSNDAFKAFRSNTQTQTSTFQKRDYTLDDTVASLSYDNTSFSGNCNFKITTPTCPYFIVERLLGMYKLYGRVNGGVLYCGVGQDTSGQQTVKLSTTTNIIDRNIVRKNGFFDTYKVVVKFVDGAKVNTYECGAEGGQTYPTQTIKGTSEDAKGIGERALKGLRGISNSGTLTTLLYPEIHLFDYIEYTDTLFPELSGNYYVVGATLTCGESGYHRTLKVIDKTLNY